MDYLDCDILRLDLDGVIIMWNEGSVFNCVGLYSFCHCRVSTLVCSVL